MRRRDFVKTSLWAAPGAFVVHSVLGAVNPVLESGSLEEVFRGFQDPPVEARLFVRWWWNGNRLSEKEILRELDVMKAAGIGGVEINPIAFPGDADPAGYRAMTMFEDDWLEMLHTALKGAKERGLLCDMIVGSGWPFGGEFLEKQEQTQMVTIGTIDLKGRKEYRFGMQELLDQVDPEIHSRNKTVYKEVIMLRLLPKECSAFTPGTDLMGSMEDEELRFAVPKGEHVLYYVVKLTGYMAVINGAPGAAGPVLNHYSQEATEAYLDRISYVITSKIGDMGNYIRAMFCDSMELEGANWNDDLANEFEKRRGYALIPYLPFVLKKVGHMGNPLEGEYGTRLPAGVVEEIKRVELDFYRTRMELFRERFLDTFNRWCHRNHVQSRMQAYGRGMHPLEASMEIDIPECETWLFREVGREYPDMGLAGRAPRMSNKYVSSGAVLAGKKLVGCEEITNTAMVFMATLEHIKIAGDQSNLSGVNHSILHGFNYSPPEAPFPGWIRYGTWFNERNPWWPYFRKWSDYKARLSYLLQHATPQANVAILQPLTDLWLKYGPQRDPFPQYWYPEYQNNLWEAVHQNGGGCDYVSENILREATFENGSMHYKDRSYSSLLLPEIETLDLETAQALEKFAQSGGRIVFIAKKPFKSPGYLEGKEHDRAVRELSERILSYERVSIYPAPERDVIRWYGSMQDKLGLQPFVRFDSTHKFLSQSSYRIGPNPLFFIANTSLSEHISVQAEFQVEKDLWPWIWNPETGEKMPYPFTESKQRLQLELPRSTSLILVFDAAGEGELFRPPVQKTPGEELGGPWQLHLNHINGEKGQKEIPVLKDLSQMEETKFFAGQAIYEKSFHAAPGKFQYMDLGQVQGVSELTLNGRPLGSRWYGKHRYDIRQALVPGENQLSIKLTTIAGNYLKGLEDNPVAMAWTRHQEHYPMGIMGPVLLV